MLKLYRQQPTISQSFTSHFSSLAFIGLEFIPRWVNTLDLLISGLEEKRHRDMSTELHKSTRVHNASSSTDSTNNKSYIT